MSTSFFAWFLFGALVCWGIVGLSRALVVRARGIAVVAVDRQRTLGQIVVELLAAAILVAWSYEVVASAWGWSLHLGAMSLHEPLFESAAVHGLGAVLVSLGLVLYANALKKLGSSWRLGIDRDNPGPLVTEGIYGWTRHPIYLAFDMIFLGSFLVLGRPFFLLLTAIWLPVMHAFMLREERFLSECYRNAYRAYCSRVRRYF